MSKIKRLAPEELMSPQEGGPATAGLLSTEDRGPAAVASPEPLLVQDLMNQSMHFNQNPRWSCAH